MTPLNEAIRNLAALDSICPMNAEQKSRHDLTAKFFISLLCMAIAPVASNSTSSAIVQIDFYCLIVKMVNRCAVRAPVFDLELPEGAKDFERIRFRLQGRFTAPTRQSPHVERESDQSTRKGRHQHSSSLPI